ncbi:MAG: C-terminal helicase domain-containing protein, partial [Pseudomonadota bacterium]
RKTDVDITAKSLKKYGYDAAAIHGDLEQSHRMKTLDGFRDGSLKLLIASDVAARGLDIPNVSHVFNFDVPSHAEDYVHRIGRTGRAGRSGTAMMICVPRDEKNLDDIERLVTHTIPRLENPLKDAPRKPRERGEKDAAHVPEPDAPAPKPKRAEPSEQDSSKARSGRGRGPRNGRQDSGRGAKTPIGMGDHLPEFIAKSFQERLETEGVKTAA